MLPEKEYGQVIPPLMAITIGRTTAREAPTAPRRDPRRPYRLAPAVRMYGGPKAGEHGSFAINNVM